MATKKIIFKEKFPFKKLPDNFYWSTGIDCQYDRTDCTEECSNSDDFCCRCTEIIDVKISIDYDMFFQNLCDKKELTNKRDKRGSIEISSIKEYVLHRLVNLLKPDDFKANIYGGYYGEEIDSVTFNTSEHFFPHIFNLLNNYDYDDNKGIYLCLEQEYGYVLDKIKDKTWKMQMVDINEIDADGYKKNSLETIQKYKESVIELTVMAEKINNKFKLIDGYHRFSAAKAIGLKKIKVIFPYES